MARAEGLGQHGALMGGTSDHLKTTIDVPCITFRKHELTVYVYQGRPNISATLPNSEFDTYPALPSSLTN
jgi:hypothetical protein